MPKKKEITSNFLGYQTERIFKDKILVGYLMKREDKYQAYDRKGKKVNTSQTLKQKAINFLLN